MFVFPVTQKKKGAAAKSQFMELINDEPGLIAALIGTPFVIEGKYIADKIASLVVVLYSRMCARRRIRKLNGATASSMWMLQGYNDKNKKSL